MRRGFTLIEMLVVAGVVVIIALTVGLNLLGFIGGQDLDNATGVILAFLRDAQQRAINQEGGRYWGVRLENLSGRDRYLLFSATDPNLSSFATTSLGYLKRSVEFVQPTANSSSTILFNKIRGNAWAEETIAIKAGSNTVNIRVFSDGRIQ